MAYLVDGNNVIGQTPGWHRDKPGSRQRLLRELAAFVAATRARVTVVFDGAPGLRQNATVSVTSSMSTTWTRSAPAMPGTNSGNAASARNMAVPPYAAGARPEPAAE